MKESFRRVSLLAVMAWPVTVLASEPLPFQTLELPGKVRDVLWDATRARFLVSAGPAVSLVNPETFTVESSIATGEAAGRLAISDDGQYLYVSVDSRGVIERYVLPEAIKDLEIDLGKDQNGDPLGAAAIVVLPGRPRTIVVAIRAALWACRSESEVSRCRQSLVVYDDDTARPRKVAALIGALHARREDGSLDAFGYLAGDEFTGWQNPTRLFRLEANPEGLNIAETQWTPLSYDIGARPDDRPMWRGSLVVDGIGNVFDRSLRQSLGRAPTGPLGALTPNWVAAFVDEAGQCLYTLRPEERGWLLARHSLETFRTTARGRVELPSQGPYPPFETVAMLPWGSDRVLVSKESRLHLIDITGLEPVAGDVPAPQRDSSGVIHVGVPATDAVYDSQRGVVWVSVPGYVDGIGNSIIGIDANTGTVRARLDIGSEPDVLALSADEQRLYVGLGGALSVRPVALDTMTAGPAFPSTGGKDEPRGRAESLSAVEGRSESVVVVAHSGARASYEKRVTVFDNGRARPKWYRGTIHQVRTSDRADSIYGLNFYLHTGTGYHYHALSRLSLSQDGIGLDRVLSNVPAKFRSSLALSGGRLYTGWFQTDPDAQELFGFFGSGGIPIVFPERRRVVNVDHGDKGFQTGLMLKEYDTESYVLTALTQIPGEPGLVAAVGAGRERIAVCTDSEVLLIPLDALTPVPETSLKADQVAPGVQKLNAPVRAITGVPGGSKLIAATGGSAGPVGNSLVVIDARSGRIERRMQAGSEPTIVAAAPGGESVSSWLSGEWRIVRHNLETGEQEAKFIVNPLGGNTQVDGVQDLAVHPDGGLVVSYFPGPIVMFDDAVPRKSADWDDTTASPPIAAYQLALDIERSRLYAYNVFLSTFDLKRLDVDSEGVKFLSNTRQIVQGWGNQVRFSEGRLYSGDGLVIDPDLMRLVGRFTSSALEWVETVDAGSDDGVLAPLFRGTIHTVPDAEARRLYILAGARGSLRLLQFDMDTQALVGLMQLPGSGYAGDLVKCGPGMLAYHTTAGELYLLRAEVIPKLAVPQPSQPVPPLPSTNGVRVVDLAAEDLAYDETRGLLVASVPNREAARGDRITLIDPASGETRAAFVSGIAPGMISLSSDRRRVAYLSGGRWIAANKTLLNWMNLESGRVESTAEAFQRQRVENGAFMSMTAIAGTTDTAAVVEVAWLPPDQGGSLVRSVSVFDGATARPKSHDDFMNAWCGNVVAGEDAATLYCESSVRASVLRLTLDQSGVRQVESFQFFDWGLIEPFGELVYSAGRLYLSNGLVVDTQSMTVVGRTEGRGLPAVDGKLIYYLQPAARGSLDRRVRLAAFDVKSLERVWIKEVNVTQANPRRPVPCGQGRVAFAAGNEIYIVGPE